MLLCCPRGNGLLFFQYKLVSMESHNQLVWRQRFNNGDFFFFFVVRPIILDELEGQLSIFHTP